MKVSAAKFLLGTCTDISEMIGLSDADKSSLPIFHEDEIAYLEHAVTNGALKTMQGLPAARDGRKILAFVRAVKNAQEVGFSREWHRVSDECEWVNVRYILRYIVTDGRAVAMQKAKELAAYCIEGGCDEAETVKDFARAFSRAKTDTEKQLERLWMELFEDHGVTGAVELFRNRWQPVDYATRDAVNAAFLAAKQKFSTK